MDDPQVVSQEEWLTARRQMLVREKEFTRQRDALNAERRRLPMTEVGKPYLFEGSHGQAGLLDLFEGRGQLLAYHFMFHPRWRPSRRRRELEAGTVGTQSAHTPPSTHRLGLTG